MDKTRFTNVLKFINEAGSADDLAKQLQLPPEVAANIVAQRASAGGMLTSDEQLQSVLPAQKLAQLSDTIGKLGPGDARIELERSSYVSLLLENPNYFGNLEGSIFKPVKPLKSNTSYEELLCVGLQPQLDRLEAVVQIKRPTGYGGGICSAGSYEYVRFFVDLHNNGTFHDVGLASVNVHDIPGAKPLCYGVYLDFSSIKKLCFFENVVKVRAILSWNSIPPSNPNFTPVWGNRVDAEVQVRPAPFILWGDILQQINLAKVTLPDPVGPIIKGLNPETKLAVAPPQELGIAEKRRLYEKNVPVHRFAFSEVQPLLASSSAPPTIFTELKASPLTSLGLTASEIAGLLGKLQVQTDGDTSFEQLTCIGARPAKDLLEGVLTVKKPQGYSGQLCSSGSTEYVAFWADFSDGTGFNYLGTASVQVHDLNSVPAGGVQYAVFAKTNFSKWRVPCEFGARIGKLRAILSWETAPPPGNPNYVPVWGNRQECMIQIRPGIGVGHVPLIETVGDVPINHIDQGTGLATGNLEIAHTVFVNQSPFGGEVTITGEIGLPPDSYGGGALPFKYKIEVQKQDGIDTFHPLLNDIEVSIAEWNNGFPQFCDAFFDLVCQRNLHPTNDSDGFGDGWYTYLEDTTPPFTRHLVVSVLGRWETTPAMEGLWKIRLTGKNPNTMPTTLLPGIQEILVRIDNTAPVASLAITGATFNGNPIPAVDCGKFPVGTIISGTYSGHDPGTASSAPDFQHFGGLSFEVLPAGPAHGANVNPPSRSFPIVPTVGEDGTWTLDTAGMDACGYVIHMTVCDRTNVNSTGNAYCATADVGFCLEGPAVAVPH